MRRQIRLHALAKRLLPHPVLHHPNHRARLAVRNVVEQRVDLRRRLRPCPDRPSGPTRVRIQRVVQVRRHVLVEVPLRLPLGRGLRLHPRRKALVQPQIVPPLRRHQVAEPLVRHLVRHRRGHGFQLRQRPVLLVHQHLRLAERDASEVFHRARFEVRNRHQVQFRHRVFDAEVPVVILQVPLRRIQRELRQLHLVRRRARPD